MTWIKYFQIITIILLVFMGIYFITPKYSFNANGNIRKNKFTGDVQRIIDGQWVSREIKSKDRINDYAELDFIPIRDSE